MTGQPFGGAAPGSASGPGSGGHRAPGPGDTRAGRPRPDFQHPDEVLEFIDGIREASQRALRRYAEFRGGAGEDEGTGGLTGTGFSTDGSVRAEVDADGIVSRVDIPDAALRRGGHLAQMILTAIREAQAARAVRLAELGAALAAELGTGTAGGHVGAMVREAIPEHVRDTIEQRGGPRG